MFEYLVSSRTRRELLSALWKDGARGTASSLARRTGTPLAASYGELKAMSQAGLARESMESGRLVYEAAWESPYASALKLLVAPPKHKSPAARRSATRATSDRRWDALRAELAAHGAPFWAATRAPSNTPLENLLADACELAHHDPSVAKVLPYLFVRTKGELGFDRLARALTENKQKHTAGFLLAVAATLSGDAELAAWAERLRDKRRTKPADFFGAASSPRLRSLAERNTPDLARAWGFRLNLSMDDFRSVLDKFPLDEQVPG